MSMSSALTAAARQVLSAALVALAAMSFSDNAAAASTFGFTRISDNGPVDVSGQLSAQVAQQDNGVRFTFFNSAAQLASSITAIYFDLGSNSLFSSLSLAGDSGAGVAFSAGASPRNLPGGNPLGFSADFSAMSNPPRPHNGVNGEGEWVSFFGVLKSGQSYGAVIDSLTSGDLRVGLHVQAIAGDYSDSFLNVAPSAVPLPAAGWLFLSAVAGFGALSRRRRKA